MPTSAWQNARPKRKRCGEIEGSQWAGVGIGPYNVRKEVQRIWEV